MIGYKLTNQEMQTHNNFQWQLGVWYESKVKGDRHCSNQVLHYYDELWKIIFNIIHANYQNPRIFEVEVEEYIGTDGRKSWCKKQKLIREIFITSEQYEEHIDKALNDRDWNVRWTAIRHPNATKENIDKALNDRDWDVRWTAIRHQNATKEHIDKALNDEDSGVRYAAIHHPNASKENIDKALNDKDSRIRDAAKYRLATQGDWNG